MNYQQVVDMLRDTAAAVNSTGTYVNAIGGKKNASEYYSFPSPQIFPILLTDRVDSESPVRIWTASILFLTQDRPDTNEAEREQIKSDMDVLATAYMNYITANYKVTIKKTSNPEEKILAGTYSGWFGNFEMTTINRC